MLRLREPAEAARGAEAERTHPHEGPDRLLQARPPLRPHRPHRPNLERERAALTDVVAGFRAVNALLVAGGLSEIADVAHRRVDGQWDGFLIVLDGGILHPHGDGRGDRAVRAVDAAEQLLFLFTDVASPRQDAEPPAKGSADGGRADFRFVLVGPCEEGLRDEGQLLGDFLSAHAFPPCLASMASQISFCAPPGNPFTPPRILA